MSDTAGFAEPQEPRAALFALHGRLAVLVRGQRRALPFRTGFRSDQSLAHIAENLGIPSLEIGCARVDGEDWDPRLPPPDGARVDLFPVEESLDPPEDPKFILDVHLGRLARHLRLLGFSTAWRNDYTDFDILRIAAAESRIVLSRDRALLSRKFFRGDPRRGMLVSSRDSWTQLVEVCRRFGLGSRLRPFSLCSACGTPLETAEKKSIVSRVPPIVSARYTEFLRCPVCGKVFWQGDHFRNLAAFVERLKRELGAGPMGR